MLLVLVAAKRAVFCWQCFSILGLALIVDLRCLRQCRQFGWLRMVPFVGLGNQHTCHVMAFYNHVSHFSVLATWEYVKRTISAGADGAVCIGREAILVGMFLIKNCTSAVPHNITLFVEFEIAIVPESICGFFIDQRSKVLPVVVIPCACFGTPQSV